MCVAHGQRSTHNIASGHVKKASASLAMCGWQRQHLESFRSTSFAAVRPGEATHAFSPFVSILSFFLSVVCCFAVRRQKKKTVMPTHPKFELTKLQAPPPRSDNHTT
jgi:hypothetical protein